MFISVVFSCLVRWRKREIRYFRIRESPRYSFFTLVLVATNKTYTGWPGIEFERNVWTSEDGGKRPVKLSPHNFAFTRIDIIYFERVLQTYAEQSAIIKLNDNG